MFVCLILLLLFKFNKTVDLYSLAGINSSISTYEIIELTKKTTNINETSYEALKILNNTYFRYLYDLYGYDGIENPHKYSVKKRSILKYTKSIPLYDFYSSAKYYVNYTRSRICRCPSEKNGKPTRMCQYCNGKSTILETIPLELNIKKGSADPFIFTFVNFTDESNDFSPGNLKIVLRSEITPYYFRRMNDIYSFSLESFYEDKTNCNISYYYIDNKIHYHYITEAKNLIKIEGKGMPIEGTDKFGDLYIYYN